MQSFWQINHTFAKWTQQTFNCDLSLIRIGYTFFVKVHSSCWKIKMAIDTDREEKRRIIVSILSLYHGGRTNSELQGNFLWIFSILSNHFSFLINFLILYLFSADYREFTGRRIGPTYEAERRMLNEMRDVVYYRGQYLSTSQRSKHVVQRNDTRPDYARNNWKFIKKSAWKHQKKIAMK